LDKKEYANATKKTESIKPKSDVKKGRLAGGFVVKYKCNPKQSGRDQGVERKRELVWKHGTMKL
jgi:hypothetical protein